MGSCYENQIFRWPQILVDVGEVKIEAGVSGGARGAGLGLWVTRQFFSRGMCHASADARSAVRSSVVGYSNTESMNEDDMFECNKLQFIFPCLIVKYIQL